MKSRPEADPFGHEKEAEEKRNPFVSIVMPAFNEGTILENGTEQLCD